MTTDELRDWLDRHEMSQGALARLLEHLGDTASPLTIRRRVERRAQDVTAVPGEVAALLNVLEPPGPQAANVRAGVGTSPAAVRLPWWKC